MNSCMVLLPRRSQLFRRTPQNHPGHPVSICCDPRTRPRDFFRCLYLLTRPVLIKLYSSYPLGYTSSSRSVGSLITRRAGFELTVHHAHRAPSNSFASEDDAIYGDAGGTTPTDTNGDAEGEREEEEEAHESDAGAEEEEEDSDDVSLPSQTRRFSQ